MILFTSDLDNTLIFSYKHLGQGICVEEKEGKKLSYMTERAFALLQQVAAQTLFVPVTTRSLAQYRRITLLDKGYPAYALTSNGATLLIDHVVDHAWHQETQEMIEGSMAELHQALLLLQQDQAVSLAAQIVDNVFVYCKTTDRAQTIARLETQLDMTQVTIDFNGEKLYVLPKLLTKGHAVRRIKARLKQDELIAAGDSYFDQSMLAEADLALIPQESVLADALADHQLLKISALEGYYFAEFVLQSVLDYNIVGHHQKLLSERQDYGTYDND